MYRCYTGTHIREAEQPRLAAGEGPALMRTAAWGLAQHTLDFLRHRGRIYGSRVIGLVGKGNNGGDTLWALSFLAARGVHIEAVAITAEPDQLHPAARTAFRTAGGRFTTRIDHATDVVLDGVFGTGFSGTFDMPTYLADRNLHTPDTAGIIACDIPSGVHADTGNIPGASLQADVTVTFGGPKVGLLAGAGAHHAGRIHLIDIGIGPELTAVEDPWWVAEQTDVARYYGAPRWDAHKYSRGVLSVVAGSPEYPGAAVLVVQAATATGVGYLSLVAEPPRGKIVADHVIAATPQVVVEDNITPKATALVIGPGLGTTVRGQHSATAALETGAQHDLPVLVDASGLDVLEAQHFEADYAALVLTPHVGEMRRLIQRLAPDLTDQDVAAQAEAFAQRFGVWVVLKSATTYIFGPAGQRSLHPPYTAELATAGTGDTLAGILGAGLSTLDPGGPAISDRVFGLLVAGVRLHSMAGQLAAADGGVVVSSLADYIRQAKQFGLE